MVSLGLQKGQMKEDEKGQWVCGLNFEERPWKEERLGSGTGSSSSSSMAKPVEGEIGANSFLVLSSILGLSK